MSRHLSAELLYGVRSLQDIWLFAHSWLCAREDLSMDQPLLGPWREKLEPVLGSRGRVARAFAATPTVFEKREEPFGVTADVAVALLEQAPIGVMRLDPEGRIVYENPALRWILGAPPDRPSPAMGMVLSELPNMRHLEVVKELHALVERRIPIARSRVEFTSIFGERSTLSVEAQPLYRSSGEHMGSVVMIADITREVELERQLTDAQKLELFSTLAGGIAHNVNNLLVGVRGSASVLLRRMPEGDANRRTAVRINEAAERIGSLVEHLLILARREDASPGESVDADLLLRGAGDLLDGLLPGTISLEVQSAGEPVWCRIGRTHLEQVFINLAVNARDAIMAWGDGRAGQIRVTVAPAVGGQGFASVSVSDNGVGMDPNTLGRVFEPFFTTKKLGQGTGLGLPVSIDIIRAHGGDMLATSEPGKGTTFTIRVPLGAVPEADAPAEATLEPEVGDGRPILVVEDNPVVCALCEEVIRMAGYRPVSAECAVEALRLVDAIAEGDTPYALALIDVGLPDIDGVELAGRLPRAMPIMLMSGNPREAFEDRLTNGGARYGFIHKPFDFSELVESIRHTLSSS